MKPRLLLAAVLLASAAGLPAMAQPISDDIPTLATVQVRPDAEQQLELGSAWAGRRIPVDSHGPVPGHGCPVDVRDGQCPPSGHSIH